MSTSEVVLEAVREIVQAKGQADREVNVRSHLVNDLGLSSMDLAELVAVLEMKTSYDPFVSEYAIATMKSVDDLIHAYSTSNQ